MTSNQRRNTSTNIGRSTNYVIIMSYLNNSNKNHRSLLGLLPPNLEDDGMEKGAKKILCHNQILCPVLHQTFGRIYTSKKEEVETESIYTRESALYQYGSDNLILDATLVVMKKSFPVRFIQELKETQIPFGDLLKSFHIKVAIHEITQTFFKEVIDGKTRFGRCHTMLNEETQELACYVRELLMSEPELTTAQQYFTSY